MKNYTFENAVENPNFPAVKDVTPDDLKANIEKVHVIDVRRPDEWDGELGHIEEAELLVLDTLPERFADLPKDETIVFICRSGNRSAQASQFCIDQGFTKTYNMAGGMLLWNEKEYPIVK